MHTISYRRALPRIIYIATYPPQQCGIASYTQDLLNAVVNASDPCDHGVVAIVEDPEAHDFGPEVVLRVRKGDADAYRTAASWINESDYDVVSVQHEFGIFGGPEGGFLLELLRGLVKPVVTTLHTVLSDPPEPYRRRMLDVIDASDRLVVLTPYATRILRETYAVDPETVDVVPHGIPDLPFTEPARHKARFGLQGRSVLMTFGLIGPSKGIERMIDALPPIVARHPEAIYLVVGATHPAVRSLNGERYHDSLAARVAELGLQEHVQFHKRFLSDEELESYLSACDVYVTPYLNREQISSGTLAYAVGTGRAVVSTRYWYAQDLLSDGRGLLVNDADPALLGQSVGWLLDHPRERQAMRRRAWEFGRTMVWPAVALGYLSSWERARERAAWSPFLLRQEAQWRGRVRPAESTSPSLVGRISNSSRGGA